MTNREAALPLIQEEGDLLDKRKCRHGTRRTFEPFPVSTHMQAWGANNREAALRLIQEEGDRANCELKVCSPDCTDPP